jgi:Fic family protein
MSINSAIQVRLQEKLRSLQSSRPLSPTIVAKLRERFMLEMTYHSNAIEGNTLTLRETYLVISEGITIKGKSLNEHLEAKNHHEALEFIYDLVEHNHPHTISEHLIRELQNIVIGSIDKSIAGTYRTVEVAITASSHHPPRAIEVPGKMSDFIHWYLEQQNKLHPVELATLSHHKLVNIHPFSDGNGRTARLLMNIILMQSGYPLVVILKHDRKKYYETLAKADRGDNQPFVDFISRAVERSLDLYLEAINSSSSNETQSYPLSILAKKFNLTPEHLNLLARNGKIVAHKNGRNWETTISDIKKYLKSRQRQST